MSEWKKVKIGDVCKIVKGTTGIASAEPGKYPLVVTAVERKTCSTYQFDRDAVCIPLVSSSGHGKKSLNNVHFQSGKFALGTILCAVIPNNPDELDARYLHQYLQFYKDTVLVPLMKGAANVSLSMKDIAGVSIPLPPIQRQRELAGMFVSLQEKSLEFKKETDKQIEYVKLLRKNILQEAIEGKLTADWRKQHPVQKGNPDYDAKALFEHILNERLCGKGNRSKKSIIQNEAQGAKSKEPEQISSVDKAENTFETPNSWTTVFLGDLISVSSGDILTEKDKKEGNTPVYGGNGINGFHNASNVNKETIVIGRVGALCGCIHITPEKAWVTDNAFIVSFEQNSLFFYWMYYLLIELNLRKYARETAQPVLSGKKIYPLFVGLPPLAEQKEIVVRVEHHLQTITQLETQIATRETTTKQLMQSILKDAFEER